MCKGNIVLLGAVLGICVLRSLKEEIGRLSESVDRKSEIIKFLEERVKYYKKARRVKEGR